MWFGTTTGLNRYDGYTFKIYQHAENEPGSLPDNYITDIVEMPGRTVLDKYRPGVCII